MPSQHSSTNVLEGKWSFDFLNFWRFKLAYLRPSPETSGHRRRRKVSIPKMDCSPSSSSLKPVKPSKRSRLRKRGSASISTRPPAPPAMWRQEQNVCPEGVARLPRSEQDSWASTTSSFLRPVAH